MKNWIDFDTATVFAIPLVDPVGGTRVCEGVLIEGPQGWGEFSPPAGCGELTLTRWLTAALEAGTVGWPDPLRGRVPIAVTVPAVDPDRAGRIVASSGCGTAVVRVATHPGSLPGDVARVEAVRAALGPGGEVRCDADGNWSPDEAPAAITALDRAAGGLEFVVQPCADLQDLRSVRRRIDVPLAVLQTISDHPDPLRLDLSAVADIAVLSVGPLGGVRRALRLAEACGLPCVVASGLQSSVGIAGGLALAGALPEVTHAAELGVVSLLAGDTVSEGRSLRPVDGRLPVAPMPAAPDHQQLNRFGAADDVVTRWRARLATARRSLDGPDSGPGR